MARPVYPHELCDPDFAWLIANFREQHPEFVSVESTFLPIVLIALDDASKAVTQLALPEQFLKEPVDADEIER